MTVKILDAKNVGMSATLGLVALLAAAGCSGGDSGTAAANSVTLDGADLGAVTSVTCSTDTGLTTITIDADEKTVLKVTDEDDPAVTSVHIGEVGGTDNALIYVAAVSGQAAQITRDGKSYTVSGTGLGTSGGDATSPVDTPFTITVTCP